MELKKFNQLIIKTATEADKTIQFFIDSFPHENKQEEAILGFYLSLNDAIKKEEKKFSSIFYKFFLAFKLNDNNILYYHQFSSYWTDSQKEVIKKYNPEWKFEKSSFKNVTELVKSLKQYTKDPFDQSYHFFTTNREEIEKFIHLDKESFQEKMFSHKCWEYLFKYNYDFFNHFCNEFKFEQLSIVSRLIGDESTYGLKDYVKDDNVDDKSLSFVLNNIDLIFKDDYFFDGCEEKFYSILDVFLIFMLQKKYELAYQIFNEYPKQLNSCLDEYMYHFGYRLDNQCKIIDIKNPLTLAMLIETLETLNFYGTNYFKEQHFAIKPFKEVIKMISEISDLNKIYNYEQLRKKLDNNDLNKKGSKQIKL